MGIAVLIAFLSVGVVGAALLLAIVASTRRFFDARLYWGVAGISCVLLPLLLAHAHEHQGGGEYAGLAALLERTFTIVHALCLIGAVASYLLVRYGAGNMRFVSGASWGFTVLFIVQLVR